MLILKNTEKFLFKPVNSAPLIIFRIIFGALMLFGALRFIWKGWVSELYIDPQFHFTYLGFEWVKPLPGAPRSRHEIIFSGHEIDIGNVQGGSDQPSHINARVLTEQHPVGIYQPDPPITAEASQNLGWVIANNAVQYLA